MSAPPEGRTGRWHDIVVKVSRWAVFGVIISLVPLIFGYVNLYLHMKPATVSDVLLNGELLILVGSLCARAIGELIGTTPAYRVPKIISAGLTMVILFISAFVFASITEARLSGTAYDRDFVALTSMYLFTGSLMSCVGCIVLSET